MIVRFFVLAVVLFRNQTSCDVIWQLVNSSLSSRRLCYLHLQGPGSPIHSFWTT